MTARRSRQPRMWRAWRFLRVVDARPVWMFAISLVVGLYGAGLTWMDRTQADSALAMLMLWQMLAASRGFVKPASAGHFDPILVRESRVSVAAAHAGLATATVAFWWIAIGAVELLRGATRPLAFDPALASAFLFVSATAWALSLPAPRLITGSLWLTFIVLMATTRFGIERFADMLSAPEGAANTLQAVAFVWLCPFVMFEPSLASKPLLIGAMLAGSGLSIACGVFYIVRRNYPLEAAL